MTDSPFATNNDLIDDSAPADDPAHGVSGGALSVALALAPAAVLAACSGGGTTPSPPPIAVPAPAPTPTPTVSVTANEASRFLGQATFGATRTEVSRVRTLEYEGWLAEQFATTRTTTHWDWLVAAGLNTATYINTEAGFDNTIWRQMIAEPGQLRQRVGMALSEMMVVGISGLNINWKHFASAAWLDILLDNAFGNFRNLIGAISTNAAMASYLTFLGNRRANAATGSVPDENYARELMQLFTLGVNRLNMDGTPVLSGGQPIETYGPADVSGLARVFTGFVLDSSDATTPDRYRRPLVINAGLHETGASTFLGTTVPAGTSGTEALRIALDAIFAHPNVPPFVSKQLIQRLVSSNPSPAYVGRIANVFADNGSGVRGDLRAVVRAILLDSEARGTAALTSATAGKLREPVMRLTGWARAFGATSPSGSWAIPDTSSPSTRLAQSMGRSQSVFNFFRPGYTPPNTAFSSGGLVAPEFQITNELSVVAFINYMNGAIVNGIGDVRADYTDALTRAADSQALVDDVNLLLAAGQLGSATVAAIRAAVDSISATGTSGPINRVYTAILLTLASPEYLAVK